MAPAGWLPQTRTDRARLQLLIAPVNPVCAKHHMEQTAMVRPDRLHSSWSGMATPLCLEPMELL